MRKMIFKASVIIIVTVILHGPQAALSAATYNADDDGYPGSSDGTAVPPPGGEPPTGASPPGHNLNKFGDLVASTPATPNAKLLSGKPIVVPYNKTPIVITDKSGRPVPSLTASKTMGRDGGMVFEDVNFFHHLAHYAREKIPERIVHPKGTGAHGFFQVIHPIPDLTRAALFSTAGKRTPVFARLSSIQFEAGSADTIHDTRGFATKFYTEQGIFDLVGINTVVFPLRDSILYPSLVRSRRRNPVTGLRDVNQFWDFTSLRPETTHHTLHFFSDLGFPASFRHMNGAGVNTFRLQNATGGIHFVRFHWRSNQGVRHITRQQATEIGGKNPDYYREDLIRAIDRGDFPSWNLTVQVMTPEQAEKYRWNPFDATKHLPFEDFPLRLVGKMVLNRNVKDFFKETEQVAFDPGNLPPGIELSKDRLLSGRSFIYFDTQRYRLGANFPDLEINRPKSPVHTFDRDGQCPRDNGEGHPTYFPNSVDGSFVSPDAAESVYHVNADVVRLDTRDDDNFSQGVFFLRGLRTDERGRLVDNLADSLAKVQLPIRERALSNFGKVDEDFEEEIRKRIEEINAEMPASAEKADDQDGHDDSY